MGLLFSGDQERRSLYSFALPSFSLRGVRLLRWEALTGIAAAMLIYSIVVTRSPKSCKRIALAAALFRPEGKRVEEGGQYLL